MALTGGETLQVLGQDGKGFPAATTTQTTTQAIANLAATGNTITSIGALNTVSNGTLTAALINNRIVARGGSQSATAFTDTTDTAINIIALLPSNAPFNTSYKFVYQNTTNAPATLTGGVGVTVSGITVVQANSFVEYLLTYTAANTVTIVAYEEGPIPVFGTFLAGGASATIVVNSVQISPNSVIDITLKTVGGTPTKNNVYLSAITAGTSFTVTYGTTDTSVYNYAISW